MLSWVQDLKHLLTGIIILRGVLTFFEVDHPETQAWKRAHLEETNIAIPGNLKFVPVGF